MIQKHRILTNVGLDKKILVELKQDYDLLEILSLKFTQSDIYASSCSDYGVVCGRISANNGLGIPNARVSIFVPLSDEDTEDPVISKLYPYKSVSDKNDSNYRYNLLPSRKQHGGHEPTGTFPDQKDILTREEILEVYEKYYSFTVKTNNSGDFMIWGVPLGTQTLHVDVDLSDMGCFSLRPDDFIRQGVGVDKFKNTYTFKSSNDIDSLPQIVSFDKTIEVYPFWGNEELCELGITRTDFDLSERGIKIEPKAYLLGSVITDQGKNSVNKNCIPRSEMGQKCSLVTDSAKIEIIRFTSALDENNRPILEEYDLNEDIDDDGSFVLPLPMNMEYLYTNEFGENEITNDPNKGVPTSACYRFRISMKNNSLGRVRTIGTYLVPNIREYTSNVYNDTLKSYAWSLDWNDYNTQALNTNVIFKQINGSYYPQDYFYRFTYNKVYTVSSFIGSVFSSIGLGKSNFLGFKEILPKEEDDCQNNVNTLPSNFGIEKRTFAILLAIILNTFERIVYTAFVAIIQVLIFPFQWMYENVRLNLDLGLFKLKWEPFRFFDKDVIEPLQRFGTLRLGITIYPECENCDALDADIPLPDYTETTTTNYVLVGYGIARKNENTTGGGVRINEIILSCPDSLSSFYSEVSASLETIYNGSIINPSRYLIKNRDTQLTTNLQLVQYIDQTTNAVCYRHDDLNNSNNWVDWSNTSITTISYEIYDIVTITTSSQSTTVTETNIDGCRQYVSVYNESIVDRSYCVNNPNIVYNDLKDTDLVTGFNCPSDKFLVGQEIKNIDKNPCKTCGTKSGYSEFRFGLFTIIPAASKDNWTDNLRAIKEYSTRKLVAKLFCEGIVNHSFIDNWLSGTLYFFPFKAKVRWNNPEQTDLDFRRTKYCKTLTIFDDVEKLFYYRSTSFSFVPFVGESFTDRNQSLGFPTTIVDLGPRDEFIKEICTDNNLDPNCSVVRNIGPTSQQDFREMLGLYINYILDYYGKEGSYKDFFKNNGFTKLPLKYKNNILNGDILQLISINNEVGIEEFDLQNRNYAFYNPAILDVEKYPTLLDGGPIPINLVLDDGEGYRVRSCLNEPGRLTESSQIVPYYYWDKKGSGFGSGVNQSWDYSRIERQPLQGMTYAYRYNGNPTDKYVLFPMTKSYSGDVITYTNVNLDDVRADVETTNPNDYLLYNNKYEGFTVLYISNGTLDNPLNGTLYTRVGESGNWVTQIWNSNSDYIIKPTSNNYIGNKIILSTPFLFYFGLKPGKTSLDKFIIRFGPKGAFTYEEQ